MMKIQSIFDSAFVATVTDTLTTKCVAGETLTRAALCHELGLTETLADDASKEAKAHNLAVEAVVGALITLDVIEGFETRKGPGGGIGKIGERRAPSAKEPGKKGARTVEFPEGFIENLTTHLDKLCVDGTCIPRRDVASAMGMPGSDTEALISAALSCNGGPVTGFEPRRGVGGGIRRFVASAAPEAAPEAQEDASAAGTETVEDASVETEVELSEADLEPVVEAETQADAPEATDDVAPEAAEGTEAGVPGFVKAKRSRKAGKK